MRLLSVLLPSLTSRHPRAIQLLRHYVPGPIGSFGRRSPQETQQQQGRRTMMTSNTTSTTTTSSHYESLSKEESYEDAYFYEPGAYMEHLVNLVRDRLQMQQKEEASNNSHSHNHHDHRRRCILDIGGGTGNFAQALLQNDDDVSRIVVVDPFLDPITAQKSSGENDDDDNTVSFVKAPAEDFLVPPSSLSSDDWRTSVIDREYDGYDQILLKEVIHHFNEKDRIGIFRGMREGLRSTAGASTSTTPTPSVLIVTRPQTDIDYPLWDEARDVWKKNQPSIETIEHELKAAGYTNLQRSVESYPCSISLDRWQSMVRTRFWSTFSNFNDDELERACESIAAEATAVTNDDEDNDDDDDVILHFEDRLIFLTAS